MTTGHFAGRSSHALHRLRTEAVINLKVHKLLDACNVAHVAIRVGPTVIGPNKNRLGHTEMTRHMVTGHTRVVFGSIQNSSKWAAPIVRREAERQNVTCQQQAPV